MTLIEALRAEPVALAFACALLGLIVGSFLNVVSLRLPRMMEADYRQQAQEFLAELPPADPDAPRITLSSPPSCCPRCGASIRPWHNVPVLGWLWLRGRCADCRTPISPQYPLVELVSGVLAGVCVWRFGWSPQLAAALGFSWVLLVLTVIDFREQLLPDSMTLPLLWTGLILSCFGVFSTPVSSIAGAVIGYLSLRGLDEAYIRISGNPVGMGAGDAKLFAAFGAWFGAGSLLLIILLSSVVGSAVGLGLMAMGKAGRLTKIPFGPYLAGAGWIALIWGQALRGVLRL